MAPGLRPVPFRPSGPVDPDEAVRHVASVLPELDEGAQQALALVEVAGRGRDDAAGQLALDAPALAEALHRARKALRRSAAPLSSTGWCERAERLLSDHLDGALEPPGPARLDAHLRHCGRCVEHERRLAQARDALVRQYAELHGAPEPEPAPEEEPATPPADLRIVPDAGPPALGPGEEPEAIEAAEEAEAIEAAEEPEAAEEAPAPAAPVAEPEPEPQPAPEAQPAPEREAKPEPLPLELPEHPPARVVVGVAAQGSRVWSALHLTAIALALVSAVLTVLAATGAVERIF